jgi:phosphotriesterase-related protein
MQFVVASGAYTFDYLPPFFADRPIDELADAFVHDIEHGIQGTSIKAGFLKCVTDRAGVTPDVEKALRATARAHRRTGVPIMTHTDARLEIGLRQQEIFADEGVDLHHVLIGHSGDSDDLAYLQRLAKRGSFLGMDRYGMEDRLSTDIRNQTVAALCELGFGDHLLLSQDTVIDSERVYPADLLRQRRNRKLTYLMEQVLVDLQARVTPYRVRDSMLIDNVRRWLEPVPPY